MADKQITPFQLTDQFTMDNFNQRINETNIALQSKPNPNLLDNWYFAYPVDQRGGYVYPPNSPYADRNGNQIGMTSQYLTIDKSKKSPFSDDWAEISIDGTTYYGYIQYAVRGYIPRWNEYAMDRWTVETDAAGELVILIEDDGIVLKNVTEKLLQFKQILPEDIQINGNTCNISVLVNQVESGSVVFALSQASSPWANSIVTETITAGGMYSATGICLQQQQKIIVSISPNTTVKIKAAKLELGSQQTLAHQENGVWVLNEIPNYADTLERCQYYSDLPTTWAPMTFYVADFIVFTVKTHRKMRVNLGSANVTLDSSKLAVHSMGAAQTGFSFSVYGGGDDYVLIKAAKTGHGLSTAMLIVENGGVYANANM